jgi:sugar phosphate isomerase/epimerase
VLAGIKLDLGFSENEAYRHLFGERDILGYLQALGFEAVETPLGPEIDDESLLEHARSCVAAGMRMSLHPYSEQTPANPALFTLEDDNLCRQVHERYLSLAYEVAQLQRSTTVVNIHAAARSDVPREVQVERSLEFFTWCRRWCDARGGAVRVVAELQIAPNRGERVLRIGDHYGELLEILQAADIGACWDFGHAVMNHRRFGSPLDPPAEFLSQVAHVHCHDVGVADHQPLIFGTVPWRDFLVRAAAAGFDGTVILEVPPQHFLAAGGLETLIRSARALQGEIWFAGAMSE